MREPNECAREPILVSQLYRMAEVLLQKWSQRGKIKKKVTNKVKKKESARHKKMVFRRKEWKP